MKAPAEYDARERFIWQLGFDAGRAEYPEPDAVTATELDEKGKLFAHRCEFNGGTCERLACIKAHRCHARTNCDLLIALNDEGVPAGNVER